jgi:hypothetical protein
MHSQFWSSPLGRVVVGLGLFTFAFWALAAAAFFAWSPNRGVAMAGLSRLGAHPHTVHATDAVSAPDTEKDPCTAMCDDASSFSYSYSTGSGADEDGSDHADDGFGWAVLDASGSMTIDGGEPDHVRAHARKGQPLFWFRDGDDEFWVQDRAIVDEVRRATARVQDLGRELGKLGAEMGRHGAAMGEIGGRMGSLSARIAMAESRLSMNTTVSTSERDRERDELRQLSDQLRELRDQLGNQQSEHARSQRELSRRMSELSAAHQDALREARAKVREISTRARREGKAERPHANA